MLDIIIKNGTIVDGTGLKRYQSDIAVKDGKIAKIKKNINEEASDIIDATGLVVTPGWVDIHSHYDWQLLWDPFLTPSSYHGVTTVVMGNCGMGVAPARESDRDCLASILENFVDIPRTSLLQGCSWLWETFAQYLKIIESKNYAIDVATQIAHSAIRLNVMGEKRAFKQRIPTPVELEQMHDLALDALNEGAVGISSSRTILHADSKGRPLPGTYAELEELLCLAAALTKNSGGVFSFMDGELGSVEQLSGLKVIAEKAGVPLTFNLQHDIKDPDKYKKTMEILSDDNYKDLSIYMQTLSRPQGGVLSLETSVNPFSQHPSFQSLKGLPLEELLKQLSDKPLVERMLQEKVEGYLSMLCDYRFMFPIEEKLNYEPCYEESIESLAIKKGVDPDKFCLDWLKKDNGKAMIFAPIMDYPEYNLDHIYEILSHDKGLVGFGDGGAHNGFLCDAGQPTFMLTFWSRDRKNGKKFSLEEVVKMQTYDTASLFGLNDRGVLKQGYKADINVIDYENLEYLNPEVIFDIPGPDSAPRVIQKSRGYKATILSGVVVCSNDSHTGNLPGELVRGGRKI